MLEKWGSRVAVSSLMVVTALGVTACPKGTAPEAPPQTTTNPGDWCGSEPCPEGTPVPPPEPNPSEAPTVPGPGVSVAP